MKSIIVYSGHHFSGNVISRNRFADLMVEVFTETSLQIVFLETSHI